MLILNCLQNTIFFLPCCVLLCPVFSYFNSFIFLFNFFFPLYFVLIYYILFCFFVHFFLINKIFFDPYFFHNRYTLKIPCAFLCCTFSFSCFKHFLAFASVVFCCLFSYKVYILFNYIFLIQ